MPSPMEASTEPRGADATGKLLPIAGIVCAAGLWEVLARGPLSTSPIPPFSRAMSALGDLVGTSAFWRAVAETFLSAGVGLVVAVVLGVALGALFATSRPIFHGSRFVVEFLKPIPPLVILPLVVLWIGPTRDMAVALVAYGCFFPILTQTVAGMRDADPVAVETAASFRLGRLGTLRWVVLPGALPFVATGLRIAISAALIIAVVAELIGGAPGLGKDLYLAQSAGHYADVYAYVLFLGTAGILLNMLSARLDRVTLHWHESQRKAS